MTNDEALAYLAETVAEHVGNGYPLEHLTGVTVEGRPDPVHVEQLRDALTQLGFMSAVRCLPKPS